MIEVRNVRFAHHRAQRRIIGAGESAPALSWQVEDAPEGWRQAKAEIEVVRYAADGTTVGDNAADAVGAAAAAGAPDSPPSRYVIATDNSVCLPWPDAPLASRARVTVRIRVAGDDDAWSDWSEPADFECGLLDKSDWPASPVTPAAQVTREDAAPVLVRRFSVGNQADHARLTITAGGIYVAYLDGQRIGEDQLAPGWTEYGKRITARTYDVTALLTPGEHEIAVTLGNGWYRGQLGWACRTNVYGDRLWLLADLEWQDGDGRHTLGTDDDWRWRESNITANDLYAGQNTDLRKPALGVPGNEEPVETLPMPEAAIMPAEAPAARIVGVLSGKEVIVTPSGKHIVDFGQNVAGWVRVHVHGGEAGNVVRLRHAEVLEHGELGVRPLRNAKATDEYTLAGTGEETLEPSLTQHGFRYVEVDGIADVRAEDFEACVVSADMDQLADFDCSNAEVNRLFANARWSAIDNFITVPTDCPQRDERLGWTGDIAVFADTATSLLDSGAFLNSWLTDVASDQGGNGGIPVVVPDVLDGPKLTCGWGDAAVLVPWAVYQTSGDTQVLERFVPMMDAYVDGVNAVCDGYLWKGGFQFGDWLDPDAPADDPGRSKADPDIVATAYFAHSARLTAAAHRILGQSEAADRYTELAEHVEQAWRDEYVTANGAILSDCATVYALALAWDLLATEAQRRGAAGRLADLVRVSGYRISTGFLGTPLVCEALERSGHGDLAVRLVLQRRCPSWLYPVSMGATTIWERWDSMLPNGDINPGEMTSFNHYALGAIAHWLITGVAGLKAADAAWRHVAIEPVIGRGLTHAHVSQRTPYGTIDLRWQLIAGDDDSSQDALEVSLHLPVGVTAEVRLPGMDTISCGHGDHQWSVAVPKRVLATKDMTIADLVDDADLMDDLTRRLAGCGSPVYAGADPDVTFTKAAKQWLRAPISVLPDVASMQGYVPEAGKIAAAANDFLADHQ